MPLIIEINMRGEIATILHRYAQANNPLVEGYDPSKLNSWITYLDANNVYETAMSEPLPVGNVRFLFQDEISDFDIIKISVQGYVGYIIKCDLKYSDKLQKLYTDYSLAPKQLTVSPDMLSDFCSEIKNTNWKPSQKLIVNLLNKNK